MAAIVVLIDLLIVEGVPYATLVGDFRGLVQLSMDWLADLPAAAWVGLLTPIVVALLYWAAKGPVARDPSGWVRLRPSIGVYLFGVLSLPFLILFTVMPLGALYVDEAEQRFVFLAVAPPLAALFWYGCYAAFIVRTRFNSEGIEYRGLFRMLFVPWTDVIRIVDSVMLGSYVSTRQGRLIVWKFLRGFSQLAAEAARHGIAVDPSVHSFR